MESKDNVRKNPFATKTTPFDNKPQNEGGSTPPLKKTIPSFSKVPNEQQVDQLSSSKPPKKGHLESGTSENQSQQPMDPNKFYNPYSKQQPTNTQNEIYSKEYETLKTYNSSKGFIRPTSDR
jgi:hypothetical protein